MQRTALTGPCSRARLSALCCLLGALGGCAVVVEGKAEPDSGEGAAQPWIGTPGGLQGMGALEAGAALGGTGGMLGGVAGGAPGQVGGGSAGGALGGPAGGETGGPGGPVRVDDGGLPTQAACGLAGNFALYFELDALWQGTTADLPLPLPLIDEGGGTLKFVLLGKFHPTAEGGVQGTVRVCDAVVPDFSASIISEYYSPRFPMETWDSLAMPSFSFMAARECDPDASCVWVSQRIHAQLGAELSNPTGAWPSNAASAFWPDHDGDRQPGVTAHMVLGSGYAYPPVSPFLSRRVNKLMLGLRMQLLLKLHEIDCNHVQGGLEEASVDSRAVGCAADSAPIECDGQELGFLDDNLPIWAVNAHTSTIQGVRMEADATCQAARDAFR